MATWDHPSDFVQRVVYPSIDRQGVRTDSRVQRFRAEDDKELRSQSEQPKPGDIFQELIVSGRNSRARNPWAAVGSLAVQIALLLAAVVIPLLHIEPLPKKQTLTMLYLTPPPAAGPRVAKFRAPTSTPYTRTSETIPSPIKRMQELPPAPVEPTEEVVGGVPGGVPGGVVGGTLGGALGEALGAAHSVPVLAKTPEPAPVKRIRVASRVAEANLIHDVPPQYPPDAGRARIEGTVVLMAVIGKDGTVQDVRVESGLPILAQAAINAVKQWRYRPYMIEGEPVEVDSRITINFTLSAS